VRGDWVTAAGNTVATGPGADPNTGAVAGDSRIRLRALSERRAGDGWVIGRIETGEFISVPDVAHRVVSLLATDHTVGETSTRLQAETGTGFAVADFVTVLDGLGFVAAIDAQARADPARPSPSLPWLKPRHVRWALCPVAPVVVAAFALSAVVMLVMHPALVPSSGVLVWSRHAGLVIAVNAAVAWTVIAVHELAHLVTARAAGVPGRITLSTRLQFLTAQTDVSGIWAAPRRARMTVYLAGMGIDVCCIAVCLLALGLADPQGIARHLLAVAAAQTMLALPLQFMVFMRTDVYFVLQDLTGCANLYADGSAYLGFLGRRCTRRLRRADGVDGDPSGTYPAAQRRAVRVYSFALLGGTAACLGIGFAVWLPALITLLIRAVSELGASLAGSFDGGAALAILLAWQVLWASRWWHRHRQQALWMASRFLTRRKEV
jgi:putative peptide zinc metalloprotease protein